MNSVGPIIINALKNGQKVLICGNGGSAAQASHFAAELVVRYRQNRKALPCICLNSDTAILTACANDLGFHEVFARQVEAYGREDDILITLSTSGKSKNILEAINAARLQRMVVITAPREGKDTAEIQEYQMRWLHVLAAEIEQAFLP